MSDEMRTMKDMDEAYYPADSTRQADANYVTVSPQTGVSQCANCRFFMWASGETISGCSRVEPYPDPILPTGKCDLHEIREPMKPEPMEVVIVERAYIAPEPPKVGIVSRLFKGHPQQTTITRGSDGLRLAVLVVSNGYKDRENEHVLKAALTHYVDTAYNEADEYTAHNTLDFWHHGALDIGDIISADMISGFLVEVAKERDTPIAKAFWDYIETSPVQWACSQEFFATEMLDGEYKRIEKRKTTILPLDAAANIATIVGVIKMSKQRSFHIDAALGFEGAAELLDKSGLTALVQQLDERGVKAKTDTPEDKPVAAGEPIALPDGLTALVQGLVNAYNELGLAHEEISNDVEAIKSAKTTDEETRQKSADALVTAVTALTARLKAVEDTLSDTPLAAAAGTAPGVVNPEIEKQLNVITEYDPMYPGVNVPLNPNNGGR